MVTRKAPNVRHILQLVLIAGAFLGLQTAVQAHRDLRFEGERWSSRILFQARADLNNIECSVLAAPAGVANWIELRWGWPNAKASLMSYMADAVQNSAGGQRLSPREREVMIDGLRRLMD